MQGFVADSMLGGFDLNQPPEAYAADIGESNDEGQQRTEFQPGPQSVASDNASIAAENPGEEICSQPVVPYVGMTFDDLVVAQQVYNDYAFKLGFGIHIGNTKYSMARGAAKDTILSRVFECVHTGKPIDEAKQHCSTTGLAANGEDATIDMSNTSAQKPRSKQAGLKKDVTDSRQRNRLLRLGCKAKMLVGKRDGKWTVTVFNEEHTHPMVQQIGKRRYYRSHRKVSEEDFQLIKTLHEQNITTAQMMGCLGSVHGGDPRCLGYVKRDV